MERRTRSGGQLISVAFFFFAFIALFYWGVLSQLVSSQDLIETIEEVFVKEPSPELQRFLVRLANTIWDMDESITPLSQIKVGSWNQIQSDLLERYPDLVYKDQAACLPSSFGYTQEQADKFFNPNKKYSPCGDPSRQFLFINQDNNLELQCSGGLIPEYVIGSTPEEERFGAVNFDKTWQKYSEPVPIGESEFVFGRCTRSRKQAVYINKYNETSANRATELTKQRMLDVDTKEARPLSVMLLIFDSVSRQHFYRNFNETIEWLNDNVIDGRFSQNHVVYDFKYSNVHGENTRPNMIPYLFGYSNSMHNQRLNGFDVEDDSHEWKFMDVQKDAIWEFFKAQGFVTMFGYDTVWDFLSRSIGRRVLTDHVATNFWHACKKLYGYVDFIERQRCLGLYNSHWYMLDYLLQFHENYRDINRFSYVHLSPAHESSGTVIRTVDPDMKQFFERFFEDQDAHPEEDYVIILASDHGKHSAEWDKDIAGYLEN